MYHRSTYLLECYKKKIKVVPPTGGKSGLDKVVPWTDGKSGPDVKNLLEDMTITPWRTMQGVKDEKIIATI